MTHEEYLRLDGISATAIKAGAKSMLHMRHAIQRGRKPTMAMTTGTLTHAAILDPTALLRLAAVWDGGARRGNDYTLFVADNPGKIIVKPEELETVKGMMDAVRANPVAAKLLDGCECETTVTWTGAKYGQAKCRPDAYKRGTLIDLKTVANIDRRAVERQGLNLGYDIQMGWYGHGIAQVHGDDVAGSTWLLYVESSPPFDVYPLKCGFDVIERGEKTAVRIAEQYRACEQAGVFPGVATGHDVWSLPDWALQESLEGFDE